MHCPCDVKSVRKTQFSGGVIWNGSLTAPLPCLFKTASGMKGASFDGLSGNTFHPSASLSSYPQFLQAHFFRFFCSVTEGIGFLQREHVYTFDFHSKEAANQLGFLWDKPIKSLPVEALFATKSTPWRGWGGGGVGQPLSLLKTNITLWAINSILVEWNVCILIWGSSGGWSDFFQYYLRDHMVLGIRLTAPEYKACVQSAGLSLLPLVFGFCLMLLWGTHVMVLSKKKGTGIHTWWYLGASLCWDQVQHKEYAELNRPHS